MNFSMKSPGQNISNIVWDLRRFGMTPIGLIKRVFPGSAPKVLVISIPKSGTHLLERALCLHPQLYRKYQPTINNRNIVRYKNFSRLKPGQIAVSHLYFNSGLQEMIRSCGIKHIFMIRDPRDIVVSQIFYASSRKNHRLHASFSSIKETNERLKLAIKGNDEQRIASIGRRMESYYGWLDSGGLIVRFEDLIGGKGGGDATSQTETLRTIFSYLEIDNGTEIITSIGDKLFANRGPTFRKGTSGGWKEHFDDELTGLFNENTAAWMKKYGYYD